MKKLIRKIVNWAYGFNITTELAVLHQAEENLSLTLHDKIIHDEAKLHVKEDSPLGKFVERFKMQERETREALKDLIASGAVVVKEEKFSIDDLIKIFNADEEQ